MRPLDAKALSNRGAALVALGQKDTARFDFERALQMDQCSFEARYNLRKIGVATPPRLGCNYTDEQRRLLGEGSDVRFALPDAGSGLDSGGFRGVRKPP